MVSFNISNKDENMNNRSNLFKKLYIIKLKIAAHYSMEQNFKI